MEDIKNNDVMEIKNVDNLNNDISDEKLIDIYMGDFANELRNTSFSMLAFIFGGFYYMVRRMILYGIGWSCFEIIVVIFLLLSFEFTSLMEFLIFPALPVFIFMRIYLAISFSHSYVEHSRKKVIKFKKSCNGDTTLLFNMCERKGNISFVVPIVWFISFLLVLNFVILCIGLAGLDG